MTEPLTDPREMRKAIREAARGFSRLDGREIQPLTPPPSASLARTALHAGEHAGGPARTR